MVKKKQPRKSFLIGDKLIILKKLDKEIFTCYDVFCPFINICLHLNIDDEHTLNDICCKSMFRSYYPIMIYDKEGNVIQ